MLEFSLSQNTGKLIENMVYLQLKRKAKDIFYYKTAQDHEVDFFIPKYNVLIQVAQHLNEENTKKREVRALVEAAGEQKNSHLVIVTESEKDKLEQDGFTIQSMPLYEWLLET